MSSAPQDCDQQDDQLSSNRLMVISADGHVAPEMEDFSPYIDPKYRREFDESLAIPMLNDFSRFRDAEEIARLKEAFHDSGRRTGLWDVDRRLRDLESEGIVAEILFPQAAPFGAGSFGAMRHSSPELERVGARAYNRWVLDHFISTRPERFVAQPIVLFDDLDQAIEDVKWAAENGFGGLHMPGVDPSGMPLYWDDFYEPFWSACEESGLPLNFHGGVGLPGYFMAASHVDLRVKMRIISSEQFFYAHRPLWWLIWSGVLERHPGLKLIFTEQYSDWLPSTLARMDHSYHNSFFTSIRDIVPHPPSYYWHRQCYVGSSLLSKGDVDAKDGIGPSRMMFGADFPHGEGTPPRTLRYLQATVGRSGMTEAELRGFMGLNAIEAFNLDLEPLEKLARKVGPTVEDVLTPLGEDAVQAEFRRTDVTRPRGV
jgi:predicted TIM-barrel fold metal-dependent hydrolase